MNKHLAGRHNQMTHGGSRGSKFYARTKDTLTRMFADNQLDVTLSQTLYDDESYDIKFTKTGNEISLYRNSDGFGGSGFDVTVGAENDDTTDLIYTIIRLPELAKPLGISWLNLDGTVPVDIVAEVWPTSVLMHKLDDSSTKRVTATDVINFLAISDTEALDLHDKIMYESTELTSYGSLTARKANHINWPDGSGNMVQDYLNRRSAAGDRFFYDLMLFDNE